jgi:glycosyltransferase involved in cell wall biosynthesis
MARLIVATLVRNEADRFLPSAVEAWSRFADWIVAVDDGSSDLTGEVLRRAGASVYRRPGGEGEPAWGRESAARALLWERANAEARPGDYIFVLDADMVPARSPRPLLETNPDTVAFNLYDLWQAEPPLFRDDGPWGAHSHWRAWIAGRILGARGNGRSAASTAGTSR